MQCIQLELLQDPRYFEFDEKQLWSDAIYLRQSGVFKAVVKLYHRPKSLIKLTVLSLSGENSEMFVSWFKWLICRLVNPKIWTNFPQVKPQVLAMCNPSWKTSKTLSLDISS